MSSYIRGLRGVGRVLTAVFTLLLLAKFIKESDLELRSLRVGGRERFDSCFCIGSTS